MERIYQLKRNDSLEINSRSFLIKGVMELKQGAYQWKEFLLTDTSNGEEFWFNIELSSREELILYKVADPALFPKPHDEGSSILEEGDATVINKSGISDVTMGNEVHFIDYESVHDNQHIFSSETWGRYSEFYVGERVLFENIKSEIRIDISVSFCAASAVSMIASIFVKLQFCLGLLQAALKAVGFNLLSTN